MVWVEGERSGRGRAEWVEGGDMAAAAARKRLVSLRAQSGMGRQRRTSGFSRHKTQEQRVSERHSVSHSATSVLQFHSSRGGRESRFRD